MFLHISNHVFSLLFFHGERNFNNIVKMGKRLAELVHEKMELQAKLEATHKRIDYLAQELFTHTGKYYSSSDSGVKSIEPSGK